MVLALQRSVGNAAVANIFRSYAGPIGSSPVGTIQRLKESAQNRAAIQALKQRYLARFPKGFNRWNAMLGEAKSIEALTAAVNAVAPQTVTPDTEADETATTEESGPETVTTTDPYTSKRIGPFNGGSGPSSEVKGAKDYVFYDQTRKYCITRDRDEHAGAAYKLFKLTGKGWQRLDTIGLDGTPMDRG